MAGNTMTLPGSRGIGCAQRIWSARLEVLRFSNLVVLQNLDGVLTELLRWIEARAPHPSPLPNEKRGLNEATESSVLGGHIMHSTLHRTGNPTRCSPLAPPGRGLG